MNAPAETPRRAEFLSDLDARFIAGGRLRLLARLGMYSAVLGRELWCEAGFEFDGYSSPPGPFGSWIIRGLDVRPAAFHDDLYGKRFTTREQADDVLLEAMGLADIPWWRRRIIYRGVRTGGCFHWPDDVPVPQQPQDPSQGA